MSEQLYWHCECGNNEPAQPEYEHGDSESCGSALTTACQECRGTGQVMIVFGFPGEELAKSVEDCDRCGGTGRL